MSTERELGYLPGVVLAARELGRCKVEKDAAWRRLEAAWQRASAVGREGYEDPNDRAYQVQAAAREANRRAEADYDLALATLTSFTDVSMGGDPVDPTELKALKGQDADLREARNFAMQTRSRAGARSLPPPSLDAIGLRELASDASKTHRDAGTYGYWQWCAEATDPDRVEKALATRSRLECLVLLAENLPEESHAPVLAKLGRLGLNVIEQLAVLTAQYRKEREKFGVRTAPDASDDEKQAAAERSAQAKARLDEIRDVAVPEHMEWLDTVIDTIFHLALSFTDHHRAPIRRRIIDPTTALDFRAVRQGLGVTTAWLAERWGVQERSVQRWESGQRRYDSAIANKLILLQEEQADQADYLRTQVGEAPTGEWPEGWRLAVARTANLYPIESI